MVIILYLWYIQNGAPELLLMAQPLKHPQSQSDVEPQPKPTLTLTNPKVTWLQLPTHDGFFRVPVYDRILRKSVDYFLRNSANKQTDKQTNDYEIETSLAEVNTDKQLHSGKKDICTAPSQLMHNNNITHYNPSHGHMV